MRVGRSAVIVPAHAGRDIVVWTIVAFDVNREVVRTRDRSLFDVHMQRAILVDRYRHLLVHVARNFAVLPVRFGERFGGIKFRRLLIAIQVVRSDFVRIQRRR